MLRRKIRQLPATSELAPYEADDLPEAVSLQEAKIITSELKDHPGFHAPVLDFDFPVTVIPSTTPGHYHLYLDQMVNELQYYVLMNSLANAGLLEEGYARASVSRGYSAVRLPWVYKDAPYE